MNEYRCTRALPYADFDFEDRDNPKLRVGYFIAAESGYAALRKMRQEFPDDEAEAKRRGIKPFTVSFHCTLPLQCVLA